MWKLYAVLEGLTKTVSSLVQKFVGVVMGSLEMGFFAAIIIGVVQSSSGFLGFVRQAAREPGKIALLVPDIRSVSYAILFGFFAGVFGTALGIYTFTLGADIGVRTLLISTSIIPGAILAWIIWPKTDALNIRQAAGIAVFLVAVWAMLDFPNLVAFANLPAWIWLTFVIGFSQAFNEILSRAAAVKLNPWVNNFWVGSSTIFFSVVGLALLVAFSETSHLNLSITGGFVGGTILLGIIVVGMISFKLLAYQGGGTIALKKIIMPGTYLVTSALAGIWFYKEPFTTGKVSGILLWFLAIALTDKTVWSIIKSKLAGSRGGMTSL